MEEAVLYAVENHIATITMNRPKSLNSMNDGLINGLHDALDKAEADSEVKCIVLTGSGKAFCAGGDLSYLNGLTGTAAKKAFIAKVGDVAKRITVMEKPVIAYVNGVTAGAGVNLMLACDLVYASSKARFGESFAKVGLIPDCGGLYFLPKAIGVHKAKELMFTGDLIDAPTAAALGMLNHVCDDAELKDKVYEMAGRLAASAPLAIGLTKKYLNNTALTLDEVLAIEETTQSLLMGTDDCKEGIAAFYEKRPPAFTGK
ncbi:enoyl-CoA hydratase-related protein [uncultured Phascolarctobacterium sp.]|uniref:enoyl-CoA hydratase/isomerase family protein n=1 Tax=uncultured Phascolarctobacterium sp. TaxID=512296 RepID=UPI0025D68378|nr:enoyl-CoA hydratase-related protein [uncultured Phascolarctobacterium sp.]